MRELSDQLGISRQTVSTTPECHGVEMRRCGLSLSSTSPSTDREPISSYLRSLPRRRAGLTGHCLLSDTSGVVSEARHLDGHVVLIGDLLDRGSASRSTQ